MESRVLFLCVFFGLPCIATFQVVAAAIVPVVVLLRFLQFSILHSYYFKLAASYSYYSSECAETIRENIVNGRHHPDSQDMFYICVPQIERRGQQGSTPSQINAQTWVYTGMRTIVLLLYCYIEILQYNILLLVDQPIQYIGIVRCANTIYCYW